MKESLISVIIPVYNVEKYLGKCLESVINQTYKNLEIICIDDCSNDLSSEILKKYAEKDSRILIKTNSRNLGLGLTRNEGIKIASGEYIHFLDSDDWLELNAYEILSQHFESGADIIHYTHTVHDEITKFTAHSGYYLYDCVDKKVNIYDMPEYFKNWHPAAWSKIYRRGFILDNDLMFNDHRCYEDVEYAMNAALKAKNVIFSNCCLLHYRSKRKHSLLSKRHLYNNEFVKDILWADENTKDAPYKVKSVILNFVYKLFIENSLDAYYANKFPYKEMKENFQKYINADILEDNEIYDTKLENISYKKVMKYDHLKFFTSYNVRRYIKTHFPEYTKLYFKIKKRVLHAH